MENPENSQWNVSTIIQIVGICLTFALNIYQSHRQRHFESSCYKGCCSIVIDSVESEAKHSDTLPI